MSIAAVDDTELVELARSLASTPSVSGNEGDAVELVIDAMHAAGFDAVRVDAAGNAIGEIGERRRAPAAHRRPHRLDPAALAERWTVDPFGGEIRDGRLYGLGICDQKASIAAAVHGVAALARAAAIAGRVAVVASVCEEEMEGQALAGVIDEFAPDVVITSEPNDTRLCIGQRGRAKAWVTRDRPRLPRRPRRRRAQRGRGAGRADRRGAARRAPDPPEARHPRPHLHRHRVVAVPVGVDGARPGRGPLRLSLPSRRDAGVDHGAAARVRRAGVGAWPEQPAIEVGLVDAEFETWTGAQFDAEEFAAAWWTDEDGDGRAGRAGRHARRRPRSHTDALLVLHERLADRRACSASRRSGSASASSRWPTRSTST